MIYYKSINGNVVSNTYETKLIYRSNQSLLDFYNNRNNVVDNKLKLIESLFNQLNSITNNLAIDFINNYNYLNNYSESINSSSIEKINIVETKDNIVNTNNKNKIDGYINTLNNLDYYTNKLLNESILEQIRSNIDNSTSNKLRYKTNTSQFVNNWRAPDNDNLIEGINHYLSIFDYQNNELINNINPLFIFAYQHLLFEIIHPFNDGNGRVGRILNVLFLKKYFPLLKINIDLSNMFFNNLNGYYNLFSNSVVEQNKYNINTINSKNDVVEYDAINNLLSFLENTLIDNIERISIVDNIYQSLNKKLLALFKNKANKIIEFFFKNPRFILKDFSSYLDITYKTTLKYIDILINNNVIVETIDSKTTLNKSIFNVVDIAKFINNIPKNKE